MSNASSSDTMSVGTAAEMLPKDRLAGLKENWKSDIVSGFILFLIALPLSLAIAIASGAPPMAGLFAAIIGGIVVSQLSGSYVTINGPAAGLIVVIVGAVERLGGGAAGYHCACAAIVVSGALLLIAGLCRAGALGYFVPATVVHGMLAAIGFIIIAKQIPVLLGIAAPSKEPLMLFAKIPEMISHLNPEIALIGFVGLAIVIIYNLIKVPLLKKVPAPIIVVTVGVLMGIAFQVGNAHSYTFNNHEYLIDPKKMLVVLPPSMMDAVTAPDWSKVATSAFWYSVVAITLIQGIETLLSCAAVDKLDPYKRTADLSRDVAAVGVGTALSGMIGGIPMIAEIVRSTANVANGAKTRWSNFFHGSFILIFVLIGAALIDMIPQACLAALLIMVGYRLASPKEFIHTYEIGPEQLLLYVTTIIAVLATDLLVGVGIGIALKIVLHFINGAPFGPNWFIAKAKTEQEGDTYTVNVEGVSIFSNFLSLKRQLDKVPPGKKLLVNMSKVRLIDHSSMDHLSQFKRNYEKTGGTMELTGLSEHKAASKHALSSRKLVKIA
jgi:MFS superfamily sulfate permease-like transporter